MILKRFFLVLALLASVQIFHLFFLHFDGSVKPKSFAHGFKKTYAVKVENLDETQLDAILSQRFHFLGRGKQMTALESEDGKYVIKLFNPMRPLKKQWYKKAKFWRRYSSLKWIKREWGTRNARLEKLFKRHKVAYEHLKDETGLVYVHLHPASRICHLLHATDDKGKMQIFFLEKTPFILQRKAILVPQYLDGLLQEGKFEEALSAVVMIEELFAKRISLGITDRIQTMNNNYGFVDGRPIQIDVGRIRSDETFDKEDESKRILSSFHEWLSNNFPRLH